MGAFYQICVLRAQERKFEKKRIVDKKHKKAWI